MDVLVTNQKAILKAARSISLLAGDHPVSSSKLAVLSEVIVCPRDLSKDKLVDEP